MAIWGPEIFEAGRESGIQLAAWLGSDLMRLGVALAIFALLGVLGTLWFRWVR